jgi:Holliday junction DNA helicase RuvA
MIATLSGLVSEKLLSEVVLEVQAIGYEVYVTAEDHSRLNVGEKAKLYIFEYIREQAHDLFGFISRDTLGLFQQLIAVNGIGPKMALNMLSIGSVNDVKQAIASGDLKYLQRASGVGRRVAERVVVDLKDKVGLIGVDLQTTGILQGEQALLSDEAAEALVSLGYSSADAAKALIGVDAELSTAERIKQALSGSK